MPYPEYGGEVPVCHEVLYVAHLVVNDAKVPFVSLQTHQDPVGRARGMVRL